MADVHDVAAGNLVTTVAWIAARGGRAGICFTHPVPAAIAFDNGVNTGMKLACIGDRLTYNALSPLTGIVVSKP